MARGIVGYEAPRKDALAGLRVDYAAARASGPALVVYYMPTCCFCEELAPTVIEAVRYLTHGTSRAAHALRAAGAQIRTVDVSDGRTHVRAVPAAELVYANGRTFSVPHRDLERCHRLLAWLLLATENKIPRPALRGGGGGGKDSRADADSAARTALAMGAQLVARSASPKKRGKRRK